MRINSITVDDFYTNPWEVRDFALRQEFKVRGNYPGQRTVSFLNESLKDTIQSIVGPHAGNVTYWSEDQYTGSFQYTVATDRSWIHADSTTDWAGVCYLTPDAPLSSGTGLFRHTATKRSRYDYKTENPEDAQEAWDECQDMTKWEIVDRIGNIFNRLILYRADNFHVSLDYFGKNIYYGRLLQVFLFNTEY
jgi:hypothetical protein